MKFGMNLLLWTGELSEQLLPVLESLKQMGFDGVELPLFNTSLDYAAWGRRLDDLGDQLGSARLVEQQLGDGIQADVVGVEQHGAHHLADDRPARLAQHAHGQLSRHQPSGEQVELRGLAAALAALQRDEYSAGAHGRGSLVARHSAGAAA